MTEKYIFIILFLYTTQIFAQSKSVDNKFELSGKISGKNTGYMYLIRYSDEDKRLVDSASILNNKFYFSGSVNQFSDKVYLKIDPNMMLNDDSVNAVNIALENTKISITIQLDHFSKYRITGCKTCDELKLYNTRRQIENDLIDRLSDDSSRKAMVSKILKKSISNDFLFVESNPTSKLSPYILYWLRNKISIEEHAKYAKLYYKLSKTQQNSFYGKKIKEVVEEFKKNALLIGKKAPVFSARDIDNDLLSLDSLHSRGYLLLDFWASWCAPCRAESKQLIKMYNKYHDAGLEILGISFDHNEAAWRNAVVVDSTNIWKQVLEIKTTIKEVQNLSGTSNEYYVHTLPTKILINKEGFIVEFYDISNLGKLENKLKEIFKY